MNALARETLAILTTLAEVGEAPASILYISLDNDINRFNSVVEVLVKGGYATYRNHLVAITDAGRIMADKVNAALIQSGVVTVH